MEDIDAVDARQHQRRGQPLQQGEGHMEEHHAADHRDHGGQAGEGGGAGGADDGDGAVGQQKGQRGAADAQIQAGGQKAAAGKGLFHQVSIIPAGYHFYLFGNAWLYAYCLVNGQKADYVGNICMDVAMIDVTDIPDTVLNLAIPA